MRLPGRPGGPLLTAEGPETELSLWAATGCEVQIALGSIASLPIPRADREVVACLDHDARHKPSGRGARKTFRKWRRQGVNFTVAKPWAVRREDRSDFNDLLRERGTGAVEERVLLALEPEGKPRRRMRCK